ncbi:hypothetical protein HZU83_01880 [Sphaerotilus montanus]|uniref:Serine protease n=1 Tax=Sphaerotilus montanus TaxID=522889 RepID=A0A7Y9QUB4_9BURK|nr:hypothetical protein [Sphaerotilus montanus]NYG31446.1 hypothetical protein [Sphaerotilus montanus]NZD55427.1 hypothetical protein [Sphaerotilus montanus]
MKSPELINIIQQNALNNFAPAIFPIYLIADYGDPVHIGTCFAFEYKNRRFLVTAAHVVDHTKNGTLFFASPAGESLIGIAGEWHVAIPGSNPREEDPFDFAWHELTVDEKKNLPCIAAGQLEDVKSPASGMRMLIMIGFPASKNKKISPDNRRNRRLAPTRAQYLNIEIMPNEYFNARGMSPQTHVAITREQRSIDSAGEEVNTIGHHGFSGGPLIYAGLQKSPVLIEDQKVIGVVLEGDNKFGVVVALRMSVILRHIDTKIGVEV